MSKNCDRKSRERRLGMRIAGAKKVRIKVRSLAENEMILFWKGKEHRQSAALVCLLWFMKFSLLVCNLGQKGEWKELGYARCPSPALLAGLLPYPARIQTAINASPILYVHSCSVSFASCVSQIRR